jgi:hypothetical protein
VGSTLLCIAFYVGTQIEKRYKKRAIFYEEFLEFLRFAAREIRYLRTDMLSILSEFAKNDNKMIAMLLLEVNKQIIAGKSVQVKEPILDTNECLQIDSFFRDIAKCDAEDSMTLLTRYESEICDKSIIVNKQKKEKGELAKKLCILSGIALMIVVI